jgi:hypothetical protein
MGSLSSLRCVVFDRSGVARSAMVAVSLGLLLAMAFAGCNNSSPPASPQAKAPPPPPPPPPPVASDTAKGDLPQMLPGAEKGFALWAGQDKDEPFPVQQFLESRALPEDNAAPLYFAALAEISAHMYLANPPAGWPWDEKKIPEAVRKLGDALGDLSDCDKLMQGAVSEATIETVLADAQPTITKLDEAQRKRRCVFISGMCCDSLYPHGSASRGFARLACIQLYHARLKGNFDEAEQAVHRTLRLSRDLRPRGTIIMQLISYTLDGMVLKGVADFTLGQQGLTAKDCDRLVALLSEHEQEGVSALDEGVRMEYVLARTTLEALQTGQMAAGMFGKEVEQQVKQANWQVEISALNAAFAAAITLVAAPYDQTHADQWSKVEVPKIRARNAVLTPSLLPAIDAIMGAHARTRASLAGIECLMAVRRYQLTHGSPPDNLDVAVREAGLKAVPTDPYSGEPMHYKVIDGKPVVYSVGSDRKDDGGTVDWNFGQQPGDFIFRIRE